MRQGKDTRASRNRRHRRRLGGARAAFRHRCHRRDVKPEMEAWIRGAVANAEPALARLTFAPLPPKGKLSFTTDLKRDGARADFIQENIPEQLR
jgi:hypothetical protein